MRRLLQLLGVLAWLGWLLGWFWALSFGFSDSYFDYHRATRIPVLLLALLVIGVAPLSCRRFLARALGGRLGAVRASLANLAFCALPLGLFWGVLAGWVTLARRAGVLAFEADEAMGNGIVFLLCAAVVLAAGAIVPLLLGVVTLVRRFRAHRAGATARTAAQGR